MNALQGSDQWHDSRRGRITGSRLAAVLNKSPYANRESVMREMVRAYHGAEREFTGSVATQWGVNNEPVAIAAYEEATESFVASTGFHVHPEYDFLGASPDGFVNGVGMIEVKCPFNKTFFSVKDRYDYWLQMQLQMACTGARWCDFVVWVPNQPIQIERVVAAPNFLADLLPDLEGFIADYQAAIAVPPEHSPHLKPLVAAGDAAEQALMRVVDTAVASSADKRALFSPDNVNAMLAQVTELVDGVVYDMSTSQGRDDLRSVAHRIARTKTAMEKVGKESIADLKATVKGVTDGINAWSNGMDALKARIRQPLTEYEEAEKARVEVHESRLRRYETYVIGVDACGMPLSVEVLTERLQELREVVIDDFVCEEFTPKYQEVLARVIPMLERQLSFAEQAASNARIAQESAQSRQESVWDDVPEVAPSPVVSASAPQVATSHIAAVSQAALLAGIVEALVINAIPKKHAEKVAKLIVAGEIPYVQIKA